MPISLLRNGRRSVQKKLELIQAPIILRKYLDAIHSSWICLKHLPLMSGFHPGKSLCAPRFSLSSFTRAKILNLYYAMGASLDFRAPRKVPFKITPG